MKLETVSCNLCGFEGHSPHLNRGDLSLNIPGEFQLVRCDNCGLIYQSPRPSAGQITQLYPPEYDQHRRAVEQNQSAIARFDRLYGLRKRAKAVTRRLEHGRLLDVGCATGDFIEVMRDKGWDVTGIEPSLTASRWAREHRGLDVRTGTLETVALADESFDVVTLWNAIEHLPDPKGSLDAINRVLRNNGLLVVTTPNLDSVDARLFGRHWIGYELPRHFYVFSRRTLSSMLEKAGFQILETRCLYGSHAAAMSSIRFWLRSELIDPRIREPLERMLFSRFLRILTAPYFYLMDRLQLSGPLTVVSSKV